MAGAKGKSTRRGAAQAFPRKLYNLISNEPDHIISWSDTGECFYLHDQRAFISEVLPRHFRHNHFSSFQRQLNLYGFKRVGNGPDVGAYFHPDFRRDQPHLLESIRRTPQWSAAKERRRKLSLSKSQEVSNKKSSVQFFNMPPNSKTSAITFERMKQAPYGQGQFDEFTETKRRNILGQSFNMNESFSSSSGLDLSSSVGKPNYLNNVENLFPNKKDFHDIPPSQLTVDASLPYQKEVPRESNDLQLDPSISDQEAWWSDCLSNTYQDPQIMTTPDDAIREDWDDRKIVVPAEEEEPSYPKSSPILRRDASTSWAASCLKSENDPQLNLIENTNCNNSVSEPLTPSLDELVIINTLSESVNSFDIRNFRKATLTRVISTSSDLGHGEISRCGSVSDWCSNQARRGKDKEFSLYRI